METLILLLSITVVCILLYYIYSIMEQKKRVEKTAKFYLDMRSNAIVADYVNRMPKQFKDNARVLDGSGKMHYAEVVESGSSIVRNRNISIIHSIGERFS